MPHPYGPEHHHVDIDGTLFEFTHQNGVLSMRNDGPTHASWCGPGPMPEWARQAGLIDFSEDSDDE